MKKPIVLIAAIVAAAAAAIGANESRAQASHVSCGDTITADTTIDSDLADCPNNGIVIGADGITLDLNGHTIEGDRSPAAGCNPRKEFCDIGVANFGHDGVTVVDGSLRRFAAGVDFGKVRNNRLLNISASKNQVVGIQLFNSSRSLVRDGSAGGSNRPQGGDVDRKEGMGMGLFGSTHVRIVNNSIRGNHRIGMLTADSTDNLIKGNLFSHNEDEAILMKGGKRNEITRNRLLNGTGIIVGSGSENVITDNDLSKVEDGIRIEKGHGNLVAGNTVADVSSAGIRLGIFRGVGGEDNVVRENLVTPGQVGRSFQADGIRVEKKDDHSLLKRNVVKGAGSNGFDVQSPTTKLTRNRAVGNGDLGIRAVKGVIDGGGNRASGNGDKRQCVNVKCH